MQISYDFGWFFATQIRVRFMKRIREVEMKRTRNTDNNNGI